MLVCKDKSICGCSDLAGKLGMGVVKFCMRISGDHAAEIEIDAANGHEAVNVALNALSKFAGRQFPPPENVSITVLDEAEKRLATLRFSFGIDYADQFIN